MAATARLFQIPSVPETCYPLEVAYWVAFGRIPVTMYFDGEGDSRALLGTILSEGVTMPDDFNFGFSDAELASAGVGEYDADRYFTVRSEFSSFANGAELIEDRNQMWARYKSTAGAEAEKSFWDEARREAADLDWVAKIEAPAVRKVDMARAAVFQKLASGLLPARAWRNVDHDTSDYDIPMEPVPLDAWGWDNFDWAASHLAGVDGVYEAVQVSVSDMLGAFPLPECRVEITEVHIFPSGAMVVSEGSGDPVSKPRVGRPEKGGEGLLRNWVRKHFGARYDANAVGDKRDALYQDVMDAVTKEFDGIAISRGTVQNYLRSGAPHRAPRTSAKNSAKK